MTVSFEREKLQRIRKSNIRNAIVGVAQHSLLAIEKLTEMYSRNSFDLIDSIALYKEITETKRMLSTFGRFIGQENRSYLDEGLNFAVYWINLLSQSKDSFSKTVPIWYFYNVYEAAVLVGNGGRFNSDEVACAANSKTDQWMELNKNILEKQKASPAYA